jgi:hypothetical protein
MEAGIHVATTHASEGQAHRCHEAAHRDRHPLSVMMAVMRLLTLRSPFAGKAAPLG